MILRHFPLIAETFLCFFISTVSPSPHFISSIDNEPPPCSLNGYKTKIGICICDKPWAGTDCEMLQVLPVSFPQGYGMAPNKTTWGGDILFRDGVYHLYASVMSNGCSLRHWTTHSQIEHAVSKSITGPFEFQDVAVPIFSHNPKVIQLQDNKLALIHIGTGDQSSDYSNEKECKPTASKKNIRLLDNRKEKRNLKDQIQGSTIHTADSPNGPWTPLQNNTLGNCNNPAPFVVFASCEKAHIVYVLCSHAGKGILKRAEDISGPWETISMVNPGNITTKYNDGGKEIHYEDPSLYIDRRGFHIIYHAYVRNEHPPHGHDCTQSTVSKYLFSQNGVTWHIAPGNPYGTQVEVTGNGIITTATRERPSLIFQSDGSGQPRMTHLLTSACGVANCPNGDAAGCVNCKYDNWDYTIIQPLAT